MSKRPRPSWGEGEAYRGERDELVQQVKALQHGSPDMKDAWYAFCDNEGASGNPSDHDVTTLRDFLSSIESGEFGSSIADSFYADEQRMGDSKESLVAKVKKVIARSSMDKESWDAFCEMGVISSKDPGMHDEESLSNFLSAASEISVDPKGGKGRSKGSRAGADEQEQVTETIIVSGLPKGTSRDLLYDHFCEWGPVQNVLLRIDSKDRSRSSFFVTFGSVADAEAVLANYDHNMLDGTWIDCRAAPASKNAEARTGGQYDQKGGGAGKAAYKGSGGGKGAWNGGGKGTELALYAPPRTKGSGDGMGGRGPPGMGPGDPAYLSEKIFVGCLPYYATENSVGRHFGQFGHVVHVELKYSPDGAHCGFGQVAFDSSKTAMAVLSNYEWNYFDDTWIDCKVAMPEDGFGSRQDWSASGRWDSGKGKGDWKGKGYSKDPGPDSELTDKVFVGSLPKTVTEEEVMNHFSQYGAVREVELKYGATDKTFRGFGFVTFEHVETAQIVLDNYENNYFEGPDGPRWIDVKAAVPKANETAKGAGKGKADGKSGKGDDPRFPTEVTDTLFVRGLPENMTEPSVRDYFSQFGVVKSVALKFKYDEGGEFRGFAFVTLGSVQDAEQAINGTATVPFSDGLWLICKPAARPVGYRGAPGEARTFAEADEKADPPTTSALRISWSVDKKVRSSEVLRFFDGFSLVGMWMGDGEMTALVEFVTPDECIRAFKQKRNGLITGAPVVMTNVTDEERQAAKRKQEEEEEKLNAKNAAREKKQMYKKKALERMQEPVQHDWRCPMCGDLQFAKRNDCRKCGIPKPADAEVVISKASMCGDFLRGDCRRGKQCKYVHGSLDLTEYVHGYRPLGVAPSRAAAAAAVPYTV
eukprot:gnl/TRDRNA2_/TRDRNA2_134002_c0_seq1.p1 gnl/TRDRNA2_/TRDRNA2_134002_c0~~gnl/TRDRNA2_/TRDRNA2_134002_c0_seq1.p1  ORF type:complete len:881 (-),score=202.27 gnl/TRDRNA2_/TRDRNA2_134002_c0_seq1:14-2623(-)